MKKDTSNKPFTKTTKGKVIYKRKKHLWKIKNVTSILMKISNDYPEEELLRQAIAINTLKTVVDLSFYPYYAKAIQPPDTIGDRLGPAVRQVIEEQFKVIAQNATRRICGELGVPASFTNFMLDICFEPIWTMIDKIVSQFLL